MIYTSNKEGTLTEEGMEYLKEIQSFMGEIYKRAGQENLNIHELTTLIYDQANMARMLESFNLTIEPFT